MKENDIPTKKETSDTTLFPSEASTYQIEVSKMMLIEKWKYYNKQLIHALI